MPFEAPMKYVPTWVLNRAWSGQPRTCCRCGRPFTSRFDRGQCPNCGEVSNASGELSKLPTGASVESAAAYTVEESQKLFASLSPSLEPLDNFDIPSAPSHLPAEEKADWEFHRSLLEAALHNGGILCSWKRAEPMSASAGYVVIRDSRVLAIMRTEILLVD